MLRSINQLVRRRPVRSSALFGLSLALTAGIAAHHWFAASQHTVVGVPFVLASDSPDAIGPFEITVVDGDTIRARGRTIRLIGFDAPETGTDARCLRERELGDRATRQLKTLIAGGGLELKLVPCACPAGTEGTPDCNYGERACN